MIKFFDENYLAKKLKTDRRKFHREIKPIIINDFKDELKKAGIRNPDIGLDENEFIYLADPVDHTKAIETKLKLSTYI